MVKQTFRITNWRTYNKALINRGSVTFWLDDEAIASWYESAVPPSRGLPLRYSDLAITTVLVVKRVFRLTLRAAEGFIDSIFALMRVPLRSPDYWPAEYADRNQAVARQRLTGSNAYWKWHTAYNRRSVAGTVMYRVKQLFGGHLTLRDYDAQVGEAMAMIRALNKMTRAGMPESVRIV